MAIRTVDVPWHAPTGMHEYLQATRLVDLDAPTVREAAARRLLMQSGREMRYAIGMPAAVLANCGSGRYIDWDGVPDVTCQMTAVVSDHGTAADPEKYYRQHALSGLPRLLFERHVSQEMTRRAAHIRHEGEL